MDREVRTESDRKQSRKRWHNDSEGIAEMSVITSPGAVNHAGQTREHGWYLSRQVNISVLVQLVFLASLIVGSWVNLQRQLDLLQRDVSMLLECQKSFEQKLESLHDKSVSYEYRLQAVEKCFGKGDEPDEAYGH